MLQIYETLLSSTLLRDDYQTLWDSKIVDIHELDIYVYTYT